MLDLNKKSILQDLVPNFSRQQLTVLREPIEESWVRAVDCKGFELPHDPGGQVKIAEEVYVLLRAELQKRSDDAVEDTAFDIPQFS